MITNLTISALWLLCLNAHAMAEEPSFDCKKASYPVEKLICSDHILASQDKELHDVFAKKKAGLSVDAQTTLLKEQRAWQKERLSRCHIPAIGENEPDHVQNAITCLSRLYTGRIEQLSAELNKTFSAQTSDCHIFNKNMAGQPLLEVFSTIFGREEGKILAEWQQDMSLNDLPYFICKIDNSSYVVASNYVANFNKGIYFVKYNNENNEVSEEKITWGDCSFIDVLNDKKNQSYVFTKCTGLQKAVLITSYELIPLNKNPSHQTLYYGEESGEEGGCHNHKKFNIATSPLQINHFLENENNLKKIHLEITEEECLTGKRSTFSKVFTPTNHGFNAVKNPRFN